jgi:uncharacterized protein (DUF952 family)
MDRLVYKIVGQEEWNEALAKGVFEGAAIDLSDGYIHLSTAAQVKETARRHFAGRDDLLLVAYKGAELGEALRYEPSRGGDLFPHLYARLDPQAAHWTRPLPLGADGGHDFPDLSE